MMPPQDKITNHTQSAKDTTSISALIHTIYESVTTHDHVERLQNLLTYHFNDEQLKKQHTIQQLAQHIKRAISLGNKVSALKIERERLLAVFDQITPCIFALKQDGKIIGTNHSANEILRTQHLFNIKDGVLVSKQGYNLSTLANECLKFGYTQTTIVDNDNCHWAIHGFKNTEHSLTLLCIN